MYRHFQGVEDPTIDPVEGEVQGTLPDWLEGSLYRNGPAIFSVGDTRYRHWFDGMAVLQRFHITQGHVTYQRRPLASQTYKSNMAAGRIVMSEFGTLAEPAPTDGFFKRLGARFKVETGTDNCGVTLHVLGGRLFAASEGNFLLEIDTQSLDVINTVDINKLTPLTMCAAHSHVDGEGALHLIGYVLGRGSTKYSFLSVPPPVLPAAADAQSAGSKGGFQEARVTGTVTAESSLNPGYFHSFAMTPRYYVFLEQPLRISALSILTHNLRGVTMAECFQWQSDKKVVFTVVDRKTGQKMNPYFTYLTDAFFAIHHINAFEEEDHLVVDLCVHKDAAILDQFYLDKLGKDSADATLGAIPPPSNRRFVLPLDISPQSAFSCNLVRLEGTKATAERSADKVMTLRPQDLSSVPFEAPTINYSKCNGKKYRYVYGICPHTQPKIKNTLVKVDLQSGEVKSWEAEDCIPSEALFVPRPEAEAEDDGVLLSAVSCLDESKRCFLLVLDAASMTELARVHFMVWFPRDQHGAFIQGV